jgi:hypothetical protein
MVAYRYKSVHRNVCPSGNAADFFSGVIDLNIDKVIDYTNSLFVEGSRRICPCA